MGEMHDLQGSFLVPSSAIRNTSREVLKFNIDTNLTSIYSY